MTNYHYGGIILIYFCEVRCAFLDITNVLNSLIPITNFNKGKASQLFSRVQKGDTLIVIKNNSPVAVVISPEEYKIIENYYNAKKGDK